MAEYPSTSNGAIIETQGMVFTKVVDCRGAEPEIRKGKDIVVLVPADSIIAGAKVFEGNRTHDSTMNWTVNNNSVLSGFTLPELELCGAWFCRGQKLVVNCTSCPFFFCRVGRLDNVVATAFSYRARKKNRAFRQCLQNLKFIGGRNNTIVSNDPPTVVSRPALDTGLLPKCNKLSDLFQKYGVDNIEALLKAMNKPLLDSFGLSTIEELQDTLNKIAIRKIELSYRDKKLSFSDFKYYIYNLPKLGWSNIDVFADIPENKMVTLKADIEAADNIDCKIVFKARRFVIPATKEGRKYEFKGLPGGEKAWIVAIKYEDGKPLLAMKEVTVENKTFDLEFRELTLDELKSELRRLDE